MVPVDSRRVSRVPRYLGAALKEDCIFTYGAVTLYGRPFQTVRLTLLFPRLLGLEPVSKPDTEYCGPTTPRSPFESRGLGSSDFARHYFRNLG